MTTIGRPLAVVLRIRAKTRVSERNSAWLAEREGYVSYPLRFVRPVTVVATL
jgi:hypothetical protein